MSRPEAMSGWENSAFSKNKANSAAERTLRVWGVNQNMYGDDKNQTGVLRPNYTLESSGEHFKAGNTWAPNQAGGLRVWEMGSQSN